VANESPAFKADLRPGDFLVQVQDELVLFLSHQQIEAEFRQMEALELVLQIERGQLEPMTNNSSDNQMTVLKKIQKNEDKITIVLDKDRGIYHCCSSNNK
jgi:C-terminal processing protease CtpA/Prc